MPWQEVNVVDLRTEFVRRAMKEELPFRALCQLYNISTKTGYKWRQRYDSHGTTGLSDRSRRPHSCPSRVTEDTFCELVRLKTKHKNWGPKKIRQLLIRQHPIDPPPSLSTVKRLLSKAGLVEPRRRRQAASGGQLTSQLEVQQPNDIWTVDFKGWWLSSDRRRIEPLTVRDEYSCYLLGVQLLPDSRSDTVRQYFALLFATYGLPKVIRSDNGAPFACRSAPLGLSRLAAWWVSLGISLDRIEPGRPQQNGRHERMHRDMARELEHADVGDWLAQQAAAEAWRVEFNEVRPHEALGMRCPAEVYQRSLRAYDPQPFELAYPNGYYRRKVKANGYIKLLGRWIRLTTAISGWHVGLKVIDPDHFEVWYGRLQLGEICLPDESFTVAPCQSAEPHPP
jgi:putative transposase